MRCWIPLAAAALLASACTSDPGKKCNASSDCLQGAYCHETLKVCFELADAGPGDAGELDASISPDAGEECPQTCDAGTPIPSGCASAEEAKLKSECALAANASAPVEGYIAAVDQVQWWSLQIPSPLPARALLTITAVYNAHSPVVLNINVLKADGTTSIARASADPRRSSAARAAQAVTRLTEPGQYYVLVRRDTRLEDPAKDAKNAYQLSAIVDSDPDANEPNDTSAQATPMKLACNSIVTATGALSTAGDVDTFKFDVPSCGSRTISYIGIVAPSSSLLQLRPQYTLCSGNGCSNTVPPTNVVASGYTLSPIGDGKQQATATARLTAAGHYELVINAFHKDSATVPPGDPAFVYTLSAGTFPDKDTNEGSTGNDTTGTATHVVFSGDKATLTGRLSYTSDADIYRVTALSEDRRLHYRVRYHTLDQHENQFPPVPTTALHQLLVYTKPTTCSRATCPGSEGVSSCGRGYCLYQRRKEPEDSSIRNFANFEGKLYLPANSGDWYLELNYGGADDLPYDLELELLPAAAHPQSSPLVSSGGTATVVPGWGYGRLGGGAPNGLNRLTRNQADDYDAESDRQWIVYDFTGDTTNGNSLSLSWTIQPAPGQTAGQRSYDVGLTFLFCGDVGCTKPTAVPSDENATFGYYGGKTTTWYANTPDAGLPTSSESFDPFDPANGIFTVSAGQCACVDPKYSIGNKFLVGVEALNRTSYADSPVKVNITSGSYPSSNCPAPCGWVNYLLTSFSL